MRLLSKSPSEEFYIDTVEKKPLLKLHGVYNFHLFIALYRGYHIRLTAFFKQNFNAFVAQLISIVIPNHRRNALAWCNYIASNLQNS